MWAYIPVFLFSIIVLPFMALAQNFGGPVFAPPQPQRQQQRLEVYRLGGPENCQHPAENGDKLEWDYRGLLASNGVQFDRGNLTTVLGGGNVIRGVDAGMHGMCVGEQRQIIIPHIYAYGARPPPGSPIPPFATLVFYVTLTKNHAAPESEASLPGVEIEEVEKDENCGENDRAKEGDTVTLKYRGSLRGRQEPFDENRLTATLGRFQVIEGMDRGLRGMCAGEKRRLTIPPRLAYGDRGIQGVIPPNSMLVFEVEMLSVKKAAV